MNIPQEIESFFSKAILESIGDQNLQLPEGWVIGKIYRAHYFKYGMRGSRDLRFFIQINDTGRYYVDYLFLTDDYSKHIRINNYGGTERLENFLSEHSIKLTEDEVENEIIMKNYSNYNEKIYWLLIEKGLEKRIGDHSKWS